MTSDEEQRLVAAARRGDSRAFAALTDASQHAVRGFLRRYTGDWGDADDLAQEAFVTAWLTLDRFKGEASFRTWVTGIGYRIARDGRRSRTRATGLGSSNRNANTSKARRWKIALHWQQP